MPEDLLPDRCFYIFSQLLSHLSAVPYMLSSLLSCCRHVPGKYLPPSHSLHTLRHRKKGPLSGMSEQPHRSHQAVIPLSLQKRQDPDTAGLISQTVCSHIPERLLFRHVFQRSSPEPSRSLSSHPQQRMLRQAQTVCRKVRIQMGRSVLHLRCQNNGSRHKFPLHIQYHPCHQILW